MTFKNNAAELRKGPRDWGEDAYRNCRYPTWAGTWEAEQFANINEGIAEILSAIAAGSREGRDVKQARCEASQSGGESRIAQEPIPSSDMGKGE
jgi:hypothetical protein